MIENRDGYKEITTGAWGDKEMIDFDNKSSDYECESNLIFLKY